MADLQLQHLNRSRLDALTEREYCLRIEPLSLSARKAKKMRAGDWIDLGERPPTLEVARGGVRIAAAFPEKDGIRIGPPDHREAEEPGEKQIVLEGRLALLPTSRLAPGELIALPRALMERIYLYDADGRCVAVAVLIDYAHGYALEILERVDG